MKETKPKVEKNQTGWFVDGELVLNLAAVTSATRSLGPGKRAAIWVQGCQKRCPGCLAQEWLEIVPAHLHRIPALSEILLSDPEIEGLTLSGGEPMLQAAALAKLVSSMRTRRDLNVICYSGYLLVELRNNPPSPGVADLLEAVDVLIDGAYVDELNDDIGLRGSSNQQVHHLTSRLAGFDFTTAPRSVEIKISDGEVFLIGVPTRAVNHSFEESLRNIKK